MTIPSQAEMRECSKCGQEKQIELFMPVHVRKDYPNRDACKGKWYQYKCRDCYNKEHRDWRAGQGERYRNTQKQRWHKRVADMPEAERKAYYAQKASEKRQRNAILKDEVYAAYGGYMCVCCGETEPSFLTIDHINNDGAHLRKHEHTTKGGDSVLHWAKKNGFPPVLQILCWNCQWGKVKNNGVCPHQGRCND